ncbi:MAG: hypothetical protein RR956_08385, partial [Christensenella sp.]
QRALYIVKGILMDAAAGGIVGGVMKGGLMAADVVSNAGTHTQFKQQQKAIDNAYVNAGVFDAFNNPIEQQIEMETIIQDLRASAPKTPAYDARYGLAASDRAKGIDVMAQRIAADNIAQASYTAANAQASISDVNVPKVQESYLQEGVQYMSDYSSEDIKTIKKEGKTFRNIVAGVDNTISGFFEKWKNGRKNNDGEKLEKNIGNGKIVYVQFDNRGRKTMEGRTLYVKKIKSPTSTENASYETNTFTSETTEPELFTQNIAQDTKNVNGNENVQEGVHTAEMQKVIQEYDNAEVLVNKNGIQEKTKAFKNADGSMSDMV